MQRKPFLKQFRFILPIGLAILLISSPTSAGDIYSVDLVTPSYVEATTVLSLRGDDAYSLVALPFSFTFYKVGYSHAYVSTNGFLSFIGGNFSWINTSLPTTATPNGAIYAFWDDLLVDVENGASVRTQLLGTAPNQRFVIEWRNVTFSGDGSRRFDFEIVLHENGVILLQYRNITSDQRERGSSATVGVEDQTGTSAVQFLYNQASIGAGQYAIRFANGPKSVPVDVKPRACPNHLNVDSYGVLHVAILGTSDFDVTTIDPKTVTMGGVSVLSKEQNPLMTKKKIKLVASKLRHQGWFLEDVGTPCEPFDGKTDPQQCNNLGPDGNLDLVLHFDTKAIADSLGDVEDGEPITLQLRGQLLDGTEIKGEDVVIIKKEKHHRWGRGHDWDDRGHHIGHDKDRGHEKEHGHDRDHD
jgi:hypothetical protein